MVFSSSLEEPLTWANSTLVRGDAVEAVREMKARGAQLYSTIGSLSLCRSLLRAGLVDRFRVVMFPVITGATGAERIYDGYPDVALRMTGHRTFDGSIQLVEYKPRVLDHPPLAAPPPEASPSASRRGGAAGAAAVLSPRARCRVTGGRVAGVSGAGAGVRAVTWSRSPRGISVATSPGRTRWASAGGLRRHRLVMVARAGGGFDESELFADALARPGAERLHPPRHPW
ncbi:hypothetical protein GCM10020256_17060 [Streptomyces thermocoprophilus]